MLTHNQSLLSAAQSLGRIVTHQQMLKEDFSALRALRQVISTHGLNRSLLAYAQHGGHLSQLLPSLPAVETLNSVPLSKRDARHLASLEELDTAASGEKASFGSWLQDLASNLTDLLESAEDVEEDTHEAVTEMTEAMADKVITDAMLDATVRMSRTADGFAAIFTIVAERLRQVGAIDVESFFTSPAYRESCASTIKTMVEEFKPLMGTKLDEDNCLCKEEDAVDDEYMPREASLTDLGFTEFGIQAVLEKINTVLEAVQELSTRREAIVASLTEMASKMAMPETEMSFEVSEAQTLISNYIGVIMLLVRDGFHHIHEALDVISDIVDGADMRSDDGRSD